MIYNLPVLTSNFVQGKKVFLRLDLDVPKSDQGIVDTTRIDAGFPTLEFLLKEKSEIIIGSHIGRPHGVDQNLSLKNIGRALSARLESLTTFEEIEFGGFQAFKLGERVTLLENLRFYDGEEKNDSDFAKKLAGFAEIYVNEAFAVSHRDHASITGVAKLLPHFAGFRLQTEVQELSKVLESPVRPLCVVIGGAKIETKLPLVTKMVSFADSVLVGGEIAVQIKNEQLRMKNDEKLIVADLKPEGTDITENSVQIFKTEIEKAKTIVWNGPMGKISEEINKSLLSEEGTEKIARIISESSAHTIVGGGDTIGFLNKHGLLQKFSFVSTGGGAMLAFLSGENLPGLEALL